MSKLLRSLALTIILCWALVLVCRAEQAPWQQLFNQGSEAYRAGEYASAAAAFRQCATLQPGAGTFQNLGNAEWQRHRVGAAVLAWEQALWVQPFHEAARSNLRFARKVAQLESIELTWYEVVSSWLPVNYWAWLAGASLWLAVGMGTLPGILRWRKAVWHQAAAAVGIMIFLLSIPAHIGVQTRSRIGFVLQKDTPLQLTPTSDGQVLTRMAAGHSGRVLRTQGNYLLVETGLQNSKGWLQKDRFGLICSDAGKTSAR